MKMIIRLILLLLSTAATAQTTMHGSITVNGFLGLDPDSVYKREVILGYNKRFQDIQTFALYQLGEAADSVGRRGGWSADIRSANQVYSDIHAYDTVGNFTRTYLQTNQYGASASTDISSQNGSSSISSGANSFTKNASNKLSSFTTSTQSYINTYADEVTNSNTKVSLVTGLSGGPSKIVRIDMSALNPTGSHFLYNELGITKRGMEYAGTGFVTQLHSLTDKEYTDKNILNIYTVSTLPTTLPNGATALVSNGSTTSGPCVAYFYSSHWYRISDNVQL